MRRGNRLGNRNLPATKNPGSRLSLLDLTGLGKLPNQSDRRAHAGFLAGPQLSAKVLEKPTGVNRVLVGRTQKVTTSSGHPPRVGLVTRIQVKKEIPIETDIALWHRDSYCCGGMSTILVLGGGVIGLSIAMMLARQGHYVTVFERDNEPLPGSPEEAWQAWERRGVAQFRQAHYLHPPVGHLLDSHLPDVKEALLRVGCVTFDALATMPRRSPIAHRERAMNDS
jgi:hypothetical protein